MPLTATLITDASRLTALVPEWQALLARAERDELTQSPAWLLPWWRAFAGVDGRTLSVLALREAGALVGLVPLVRWRPAIAPLVQIHRVEPMGTGEDEADEVCSDYTGLLAARGALPRVADAFADALADGTLGPVDEILWPGLAAGDAAGHVVRALRRAGFVVTQLPVPAAPYIPLPARWDDYLAALGQDKRYAVKRALRELETWSGGDHAYRLATTPAELAEGLAVLRSLHGERWEAAGKAGVFASSRFTGFLDDCAAGLLANGHLELSWLLVKGTPIAAAFNVVWDGRVHFYQAGRAMDVPPKVKPGVALHAMNIQRAIAAGRREYDFLAGESRYKLDLALAKRPLVSLRATRPSLRLGAVDLARQVARRLRDLR